MLNSRLITELTPEAQVWFHRFAAHTHEAGLVWGTDWGVDRTKCDQEFQDYLYEQGRSRPGKIVTWTRDSRHICGEAWDCFIMEDGKAIWFSPKYGQIAEIGKGIGLECGYFWPRPKTDPGHYQIPRE